MDITYLGHSSFRLRGKSASLITDPYDSEMVGFKYPRMEANIVTVSHDHADHNKVDQVNSVEKVISGPGEYEIKGVSIIGIPSYHDNKKGTLRGKNTIYVIEMDKVRIVHLGDLGHTLKEDFFSSIGDIDVLMIPVGGEYTIGPLEAAQLVELIEPEIVLPMHYKVAGLKETFAKLLDLDSFLKEVGLVVEKVEKLTVKKENLLGEQKVIVLENK